MISVRSYSGSRCQAFYTALQVQGLYFVSGPYVYDCLTKASAQSSFSLDVSFPRPIQLPYADNLVDMLVGNDHTLHGQHACVHSNGKGFATVVSNFYDSISQPRFTFAPATDDYSVRLGGCYWFFKASSSNRNKVWSGDAQIGYQLDSTNILRAGSSSGITAVSTYYPSHYTASFRDGTILYNIDANLQTGGHVHVITKSDNGTWNDTEYIISNFTFPNLISYSVYTKGVLTKVVTNGKMPMIPVTVPSSFASIGSLPAGLSADLSAPSVYVKQHAEVSSGTLAHQVVSSMNYVSSNSLENTSGWLDVRQNLPPFDISKLTKPKGIAQLYLWYQYSLKPNLQDIPEVYDGLKKYLTSKKFSYDTRYATLYASRVCKYGIISTRANGRVRIANRLGDSGHRTYQTLDRFGLLPTPENLWDLIPFSFVVDWFYPVGSSLSDITYSFNTFMNVYDVYDYVESRKSTLNVNLNAICGLLEGSAIYSHYNRDVSQTLPADSFQYGSKSPSKHILDGASLIVANW